LVVTITGSRGPGRRFVTAVATVRVNSGQPIVSPMSSLTASTGSDELTGRIGSPMIAETIALTAIATPSAPRRSAACPCASHRSSSSAPAAISTGNIPAM